MILCKILSMCSRVTGIYKKKCFYDTKDKIPKGYEVECLRNPAISLCKIGKRRELESHETHTHTHTHTLCQSSSLVEKWFCNVTESKRLLTNLLKSVKKVEFCVQVSHPKTIPFTGNMRQNVCWYYADINRKRLYYRDFK